MNQGPTLQENVYYLQEGDKPSAISLRDIVAPLFRQRRLILYSFTAIFVLAIGAAIFVPKQYRAEMMILVKRERIDETVTSNKTTVLEARPELTEEQVQSEVELIRSRDL